MRISSELFPFASHDKYGYDLDYATTELKVRTQCRPTVAGTSRGLTATSRRLPVILPTVTAIE